MFNRIICLALVFLGCFLGLNAQDDPVLFTVGDTKVNLSEFNYIYSKTNGNDADYSKASVDEYLDLYVKFKLKVQKAKEMQIDTIPSLKRELDGYRKQLASSYLLDKTVKERLLKEAYERQKKDINASHIMVSVKGRKQPKDTLEAYNKIMAIKKELDSGSTFEKLVVSRSEDTYSNKNEGQIGWLTAILPNGFYEMESAAYNTAAGKYSAPFRTGMGYHILKVNETRAARGNIELAHIVVFDDGKEKAPAKDPKSLIEKAHADLKAGGDFDQIARNISDDKKSASKGGYLGFFGIGVHEKAFEDAAFSLKNDGDYTAPIKSSTGWHIIKRVSKPKLGSYETEKNRLQSKIERDSRFQEARNAMIVKIKAESKFSLDEKVLESFTSTLGKEFLTTKWRAPKKSDDILFSFNDESKYTLGDFTDYLLRAAKQRMSQGRSGDVAGVVKSLLDTYSNDMALEYEKSQLSKKYPDFRSLMREYEEGIILFEVTKMLVWDKASQDTTGLKAFYNKNQDNYLWGERAETTTYTLKSQSEKILAKVRKLAKKKSSDAVLSKINKKGNLLTVSKGKAEKGKKSFPGVDDLVWKKGTLSPSSINNDNTVSFVKIEQTLPREKKALKDARGYVIADYQDQLEQEWIKELKASYPVKINKEVLNSFIK